MDRFRDRTHAGQYLAEKLQKYAHKPKTIVLGLPRGGVVVAHEIAQKLGLPLDIFLVRKLGVPGYEELAMGAIASGGVRIMNQDVLRSISISRDDIQAIAQREEEELKRRETAYRNNRPRLDLKNYTVILVDDGLATGATMRAAVVALRKHDPQKIIIAVPTASPDTCAEFQAKVDEIICGITPSPFNAVGLWYDDFSQTSDEEVQQLLKKSYKANVSTESVQ
jgi:Predicted phosphoribosyltransferases